MGFFAKARVYRPGIILCVLMAHVIFLTAAESLRVRDIAGAFDSVEIVKLPAKLRRLSIYKKLMTFFKKFVNDYFEMKNNPKDYLLLKNLKALYQSNKDFDQSKLKNLKEHLEREFNSDFKEKAKVKINNKYVDVRSIIYGWKLITNEDEEEEKSNLDI